MGSRFLRGAIAGMLAAAVTLTMAACAPDSLGFEHDDQIIESVTLGSSIGAYAGIDLQNVTNSPVTLNSVRLVDAANIVAGKSFVIRVTHGGGIGLYPPPLTRAMQLEFARSTPLSGFVLPAHSKDVYEAVLLLTPRDRLENASTSAAVVSYRSGSQAWSETRHSAFCLSIKKFSQCGLK